MPNAVKIAWLLLVAVFPAQAAEPTLPAPLELRYRLVYGGMTTGRATLTLTREADGSYKRVSRSRPEGMARMFTTVEWVDESHFEIFKGQVRPLSFLEYRIGAERSHRQFATFDWKAGVLRYEFGKQTLPLRPGTQDLGSMQFAWMLNPPAAGPEQIMALSSGKKLKDVKYRRVGQEKITTDYGSLDALVLERLPMPDDKERESFRVWLATAHRNLPVRMATEKRGQETVLLLESVTGLPNLAPRAPKD
jgi:Protein of unknown function (DUF3108)